MAKADIKICGYDDCPAPGHKIDISQEEYAKDGRRYFHPACLKKKIEFDQKKSQQIADIQYIKNLWTTRINNTVNYGALVAVLNDYISRGVSTDYLVYVLEYVIRNQCNLTYPSGFRYYVDKKIIKDSYAQSKIQRVKQSDFKATTDGNDTAPEFTVTKKETGFHTILGGK